jgi:magnesium transporter
VIINGVAYQSGRKLADIQPHQIKDYITKPDTFVWVALRDPEAAELEAMQREFDLHELSVEDARHGHQRPKIEEYGQSLFVVLHMIEPADDDLRVGESAIFVGTNYVLSVRRGVERGFGDVRKRTEQEPHLLQFGPAYVLYALMDAVVDRYAPLVDMLTSELETIEERIFAQQASRANVEALYGLKRKLVILKHATSPLLDAISKLYGGRVPQLCLDMQEYFRDVSDHLVRINQAIDGLRDSVTTAMSVHVSFISLQENEVTKRLAAYAALVAVPTALGGIYGMNFEHMPELGWQWAYPLVWLVILGVDGYLVYRFRKAKWL